MVSKNSIAGEETGPQAETRILSASPPKTGAPALSRGHPRDVPLSVPSPSRPSLPGQLRPGRLRGGAQRHQVSRGGRATSGVGAPAAPVRGRHTGHDGFPTGHARPGVGDPGQGPPRRSPPVPGSPRVLCAGANDLARHCGERALSINHHGAEGSLNSGVFRGNTSGLLRKQGERGRGLEP